MSLSEVCYAQIHDNFWYGQFGDFNLIIDRATSYFNATKLCDAGGKRFKNWFQNKQSKELFEYISSNGDLLNAAYYNVAGGKGDLQETIRGTYVSSYLLLAIASWVSPECYVKANTIVI